MRVVTFAGLTTLIKRPMRLVRNVIGDVLGSGRIDLTVLRNDWGVRRLKAGSRRDCQSLLRASCSVAGRVADAFERLGLLG